MVSSLVPRIGAGEGFQPLSRPNRSVTSEAVPDDLKVVIEAWERLPENIMKAIVALMEKQ